MTYKVIQWGTGNVGKHALRSIIQRSDLELVGLKVYSPDKEGVDAGDIVKMPKTGIKATTSVDKILSIPADCVVYNALGMTIGDIGPALDDICMLLEAGYNVISSAIEQAVYPKALQRAIRDRLEKACARQGKSFLATGINPGFTMDLWPIQMSRLSREIESIHVIESCDMRNYGSPNIMQYMGFGRRPEDMGDRDERTTEPTDSPFHSSMLMVADALRFKLSGFRSEHMYGVADKPLQVAAGAIERGTIAVVKMRYIGEAYGRDVLTFEWVWRVADDIKPEWGVGEFWSMSVKGDPAMECRIEASTNFDSKRIVSLTVATTAVNSIPPLCDASPGVKSVMDLMPCGGGHVVA